MLFLIMEKIFEALGVSHSHWHNDEDEKKEGKAINQSTEKLRESVEIKQIRPEETLDAER
jgi:hypothetical protein